MMGEKGDIENKIAIHEKVDGCIPTNNRLVFFIFSPIFSPIVARIWIGIIFQFLTTTFLTLSPIILFSFGSALTINNGLVFRLLSVLEIPPGGCVTFIFELSIFVFCCCRAALFFYRSSRVLCALAGAPVLIVGCLPPWDSLKVRFTTASLMAKLNSLMACLKVFLSCIDILQSYIY